MNEPTPIFTWRMPRDMREVTNSLAKQEQRSLANMIKVLVNEALNARKLKTEKASSPLE